MGRTRGIPSFNDFRIVQIEEVTDDGIAMCLDSIGKHVDVLTTVTAGKGFRPVAGEQWVLKRALDGRHWVFHTLLNRVTPSVTGSRASGAALLSLLEVLSDAGVIVDDTTA